MIQTILWVTGHFTPAQLLHITPGQREVVTLLGKLQRQVQPPTSYDRPCAKSNSMRYPKTFLFGVVALLSIVLLPANLTAQVNATAEIQAHHEFVLGDYATQDYTAKLTNRGDVPVMIRCLSKGSGEVTRTVTLPARGRLSLKVVQDETVIFVNDSDEYVEVNAKLSYGVEGMSSRPITKDKL